MKDDLPCIMEPTMILAYSPWDKLHQLWKDRYSDKVEWRSIKGMAETEKIFGLKIS